MLRIIRKSVLAFIGLFMLTACEGTVQKLDEWGKSMPTHDDAWCEGWFCWGSTTTKQKAFFKPEQNPGGEAYSPQANYPNKPAPNMQDQQLQMKSGSSLARPLSERPVPQKQLPSYSYGSEIENRAAKEIGIKSPEEAYGKFEVEGGGSNGAINYGNAPSQPSWPKGSPPAGFVGSAGGTAPAGTIPLPPPPKTIQNNPLTGQDSRLPEAFSKDDLPPGAIPGENWPPVPPEEEGEGNENTFGFGPSFR
jgi:hypothetical protein